VVRALLLLFCPHGYEPIWAQTATSLEQVKRVFVGPFGGSAEAQEVQQALNEELRKHGKLGIADSPAESDAVLTGSGGVYVKGYYSLNPRARSIGEDAHPVYGGYFFRRAQGRSKRGAVVVPGDSAPVRPSRTDRPQSSRSGCQKVEGGTATLTYYRAASCRLRYRAATVRERGFAVGPLFGALPMPILRSGASGSRSNLSRAAL